MMFVAGFIETLRAEVEYSLVCTRDELSAGIQVVRNSIFPSPKFTLVSFFKFLLVRLEIFSIVNKYLKFARYFKNNETWS